MTIKVFVAAVLAAACLSAQSTQSTCSPATLKGTYGVWEQGTFLAQLPGLPTPPFPVVNVVIASYDGAGNFSGKYTASYGGVTVPGTFSGTYTVNADCTYSDQFTPSPGAGALHHAGTITGGALSQQINYIYTDPLLVAWGTARRTPPGGCSLATVKGAYGLSGQGTITAQMPGLPPPPVPVAHSGIYTSDGAGSFSGDDTMSFDGTIMPDTFTATYAVNHNCTVSAAITTSLGVLKEVGTITGFGTFQEVHTIITNAGWVFADTAKEQ
jgi:hypothetical protein